MNSIQQLFEDRIRDLYNAEQQLVKALPKMAKASSSPDLRRAFEAHLEETKQHVERLSQIAEASGFRPAGKRCKAMEGLIEEGGEAIEAKGDEAVHDMNLVAAAQRVEHYEIAGYGNARHYAEVLGDTSAARMLQQTLDEEAKADRTLTKICEDTLVPAAPKRAEMARSASQR